MVVFRRVQNTAPYNSSTPMHSKSTLIHIIPMDFGNPHTNFGVLLSMHVWVMSFKLGLHFCSSDLMLVHVSSKKMYL